MENKYYVPDLEEFHVGFEYEINEGWKKDAWEKVVWSANLHENSLLVDVNHSEPTEVIMDMGCCPEDWVRVKYLDREDIESLGFEVVKDHRNWLTLKGKGKIKNCDMIHVQFHRSNPTMVSINNQEHYEDHFCWFEGKIKNKSELKKVLKMIGYE